MQSYSVLQSPEFLEHPEVQDIQIPEPGFRELSPIRNRAVDDPLNYLEVLR